MSKNRDSRDKEPKTVPIDPEGEQRELEAAGWERLDVQGKVLWVNPQSGHRYPQGPAIRRLRQIQEEAEQGRGEGRGVSVKELGRLRQAVARLLDAQEDASDAARRGLELRRGDFEDEESSEASGRLEELLVDVLDILEGAADDVRGILGDVAEDEARRAREEVERIEAQRLRLSEAVMKGDEKALEEDRRLELRIRELAGRQTGGDQDERRVTEAP